MANIQVGKPVKGSQLIGREKEMALISELLSIGQSIVIIAPRRFGKTSLILEILDRLKTNNFYTAYIDFFTTPNLESLSHKITEEVLNNRKLGKVFRKISGNITEVFRNIELKQTIESFEFILKYGTSQSDEWELLSDSIDFIDKYPEKYGKKIVCAFDEFGDISKFDGDKIVKMVRSKIQMQENATYIFSGSYESVMETLFVKPDSPFFRFARIINLGYIERDSFKRYILKTFKTNNVTVKEDIVDGILDFTKGHPYYTQLIVQQIILNKSAGMLNDKFKLKTIIEQVLLLENNYLEKQWEDINQSRENVQTLIAVVKHGKSLYSHIDTKKINLGRALKKLIGTGIVFNRNKYYYMSDPLFELWIKNNVLNN